MPGIENIENAIIRRRIGDRTANRVRLAGA